MYSNRTVNILPYGGKLWRNWRLTKHSPNFHHPNLYASVESHVNIEQIYWKVFLRHVPNNLQLGYHRSPLDGHGLWIVRSGLCEFLVSRSPSKSLSTKGLSHIEVVRGTICDNINGPGGLFMSNINGPPGPLMPGPFMSWQYSQQPRIIESIQNV